MWKSLEQILSNGHKSVNFLAWKSFLDYRIPFFKFTILTLNSQKQNDIKIKGFIFRKKWGSKKWRHILTSCSIWKGKYWKCCAKRINKGDKPQALFVMIFFKWKIKIFKSKKILRKTTCPTFLKYFQRKGKGSYQPNS